MFYNKNFKDIEWNKLIKGIRFTQGLTQEELGKKLNLSRFRILSYEQGKKPWIKIRNRILKYIQDNKLPIKELFETYSKIEYLDKNYLWGKLSDGIQTINGWSNKNFAKLLNIDKTRIESWKVKKLTPKPNLKSKILKLIDNQNIKNLLKYSDIDWKQYFYEIKKQLPLSKTMLAKLLGFNEICINGLIKYGKPQFKSRKELVELNKLIKKREDIRDVIFEKRKQRFFDNKFLWFRCIREKLDISQAKLVKNTRISQDLYARFELGQQNLVEEKRNIIEKKFKTITKIKNINYNKLKLDSITNLNNYEIDEIKQWKLRKNIHEIIGFRMLHKKERLYINRICELLNKQGFITFTNPILADNNLNIFNVDIYTFKNLKQKQIRICIEVRDRTNNMSTSALLQPSLNRLKIIKDVFNFDYSIFLASNLTKERKSYSHKEIILLDTKDLEKLKNDYSFLDLLKSKNLSEILEMNTIKDFKQYLRQNKLTLRDVSSITNLSFSSVNKWKDKDLKTNKEKITQLINLVNTKGIAYIKFQRYKKIYTNNNFLKLKAIKIYLNLNEKDFKLNFGLKPSELVDDCLKDNCHIPKELLSQIKDYVRKNNYDWKDLLKYIEDYTNKEFKKWRQLEEYNKLVGWKFIKFLDNTNTKSKLFEDRINKFLSKKYKYTLKNIQVYLDYTNQIREIDLISFNTNKDILITECKLKIPGYGSKILLNDLDIIKKAINAKHSWLVTQKTNLNKEFNQLLNI